MIDLVQTVGPELGIVAACAALGVARATYYRQVKPPALGPAPRKHNARATPSAAQAATIPSSGPTV